MYKNGVPAEYIARQASRDSRAYTIQSEDGWQLDWQTDPSCIVPKIDDEDGIPLFAGSDRIEIDERPEGRPPHFLRTN